MEPRNFIIPGLRPLHQMAAKLVETYPKDSCLRDRRLDWINMDNDKKYEDIAIRCLCEIREEDSGKVTRALVKRIADVIKQQTENYVPLLP